ncbi:MAG: hypothetical protein PHG58_11910 [Clostridia bacterium]|nr:hypothetical protein [Clostridia bacterium]
MKREKPAHGDIRDLEKISSYEFKNEILEVTEEELRIRETTQTAKRGDSSRNKGN